MARMAIETPPHTRMAPELERPYWHDHYGERLTFQEVVGDLAGGPPPRRPTGTPRPSARRRAPPPTPAYGERAKGPRQLAPAASRLREEIAGSWPRDFGKPIR